MSSFSAAKNDSFAAAESIPGDRHGYDETKLSRIAASYENAGVPQSQIEASKGKLAAPDP